MKLTETQIIEFQTMIFSWWKTHRRELPWRNTRDPYAIHVSEVMLQQTQVSRVLPKFDFFISQFPTVSALAKASVGDVLIAWKGMGYNRRGLYLKRSAEIIVQDYHGIYPKDEQKLRKLPGLGIYTARAILVFAYEMQIAFVDTNIRQIFEHYFFQGGKQKDVVIQNVADVLLPLGKAWDWHQALMDYGSLELAKVKPPMKKHKVKFSFRFEDTNRFIRGRIMDLVRDTTWDEQVLITTCEKLYGKSQDHILYNLNKLILEGLLEKDNSTIRLPR